MAAIRYSKQREAIRMYLLSTKSHPTAEAVYNNIKNEHPRISLGTVYRNLNLLVEQGEALRLDCGDGTGTNTAKRYTYNSITRIFYLRSLLFQ